MPSLPDRLASILRDVLPAEEEPDGALTVRHDGTFASLRVVSIAEDLELVSLTQILAWDLPLTKRLAEQVAKQARDINFGSVSLREKVSEKAARRSSGRPASNTADVMLRYNFPGTRRRVAHVDPFGAGDGRHDPQRARWLGVCSLCAERALVAATRRAEPPWLHVRRVGSLDLGGVLAPAV